MGPPRSSALSLSGAGAVTERSRLSLIHISLEDGSLLRGTGRSHRTEDGVLTFFVSYNMFVMKPESQEASMEGLEANTQLRLSLIHI